MRTLGGKPWSVPYYSGNGWFIDTTPADNSEFLPTSNPDVWVAKEGTAAYGKMDMLSVLLHEYGHALGIEHSADSNDYMGATLKAGERRLPSATELALMQNLVAQMKGDQGSGSGDQVSGIGNQESGFISESLPSNPFNLPLPFTLGGLAFAGLLRPNRYGSSYIDTLTPNPSPLNGEGSKVQYEAAANAAFVALDTPTGWNTEGGVDINGTAATLREVSGSQTHLGQVFTINSKDRYLTFTLSGAAIDDLTNGPDDAFEVALLDANNGGSLLGTDGLTRTDAILNLQGDGTQHLASGVTCTYNAPTSTGEASRTYRVDLSGLAAGTVANLSFDLIGFGSTTSHLTLSDIRVSGLPQLIDSATALLEDNTMAFDPFAQADAQLRPLLTASVVNAPTHGTITVNADGTCISDTLLACQPFAGGDAGRPLPNQRATPHRVVVATYTPDANYNGTDSFSYKLSDGPLDSNIATVITNDLAGVVGQPSQMASSSTSLGIASVSDAPTGTDKTVTTLEDTQYIFQVSDFGFSDALDAASNAGANNFVAVTIATLPAAGSLTLNGVAVTAGQSIGVAN